MPVSNVASDWPRTFLHPRCFCLAYDIYYNIMNYCICRKISLYKNHTIGLLAQIPNANESNPNESNTKF